MNERPMFFGASNRIFQKAAILRNNETEGEKLLWSHLRKNQIDGFRFRRQHPINIFVADFYCHKAKLVIEVDESHHQRTGQRLKDENRGAILAVLGIQVIRFSAEQVFNNIVEVIAAIKQTLRDRPQN
jgi:very-short-patch-repair endonuclease